MSITIQKQEHTSIVQKQVGIKQEKHIGVEKRPIEQDSEYPLRTNFTPVSFYHVENLAAHLKEAVRLTNCHNIFSIGSGNGVIEYQIAQEIKNEIICVDPEPESYYPYPKNHNRFYKPKYKTVQDIPSSYIGDCIVFIFWSTPFLNYDYEAIQRLKPKAIVVTSAKFKDHKTINDIMFIYDENPSLESREEYAMGFAGSGKMLYWLETQRIYQEVARYENHMYLKNPTYYFSDSVCLIRLFISTEFKVVPSEVELTNKIETVKFTQPTRDGKTKKEIIESIMCLGFKSLK